MCICDDQVGYTVCQVLAHVIILPNVCCVACHCDRLLISKATKVLHAIMHVITAIM